MHKAIKDYKTMFGLVGEGAVAVLDNSFIWSGIKDEYFGQSQEERIGVINDEIAFYDGLSRIWKDNCLFTKEILGEFKHRTKIMKAWATWSETNDMPKAGESLRYLINRRTAFSRNLMRSHLLEDRLSEKIKQIYLPHIENCVRAIDGKIPREGKKESLVKHGENDLRVISKCLAYSYSAPVVIGTNDGDFVNILNEFYSGDLGRHFGFPMPSNAVELLLRKKNKVKLISRGTKKGSVNLNGVVGKV